MAKSDSAPFSVRTLMLGTLAYRPQLLDAGFASNADLDASNGQVVKLHLSWQGRPLGLLCLHRTSTGFRPAFHEITVPAFRDAIEEACLGDPDRARRKAEVAAAASEPSVYDVHAYVAVAGSPFEGGYAVVVERAGVAFAESYAYVEGSLQEVEAAGAARLLERCGDLGIDRTAVHASPFVVNVATGAFKATRPATRALAAAVRTSTAEILWVVDDGKEPGMARARRLAQGAYEEACYNDERMDVPF